MIVIRGRWTKSAKRVLEALQIAFPQCRIDFTPTSGTGYQLVINRSLVLSKPSLSEPELRATVQQFLAGRQAIKRGLQSVLDQPSPQLEARKAKASYWQ